MNLQKHKADIIVIVVAIALCVVTLLVGITITKNDGKRNFCDIVNATIAVPAIKPTEPKLHPGAYEEYLVHQRFLRLKAAYNCGDGG